MRILNFTKQGHSIKIALVFLVLVKKSANLPAALQLSHLEHNKGWKICFKKRNLPAYLPVIILLPLDC